MISSKMVQFSRKAIHDLVKIHIFISQTDPVAADRFVDAIERKVHAIGRTGFTGVSREELGENLRALPYKRHCIYFRVTLTSIQIVRILHGRQDTSTNDFPESDI